MGAGGWIDQNHYPRELADVNGDGKADIVAFGHGGVNVSLATGNGSTREPVRTRQSQPARGSPRSAWVIGSPPRSLC